MGKIIAVTLLSVGIVAGGFLFLRPGGNPSEPISEPGVSGNLFDQIDGIRGAEVLVDSTSIAGPESASVEASKATLTALPVSLEEYEPEFAQMLGTGRNNDVPDWGFALAKMGHGQVAAERRDPEWAAQVEEQWRQYYAGKPETFIMGDPFIYCGSTMCEVRFLSNGYWPEEYSDPHALREILTERPGAFPRPCGMPSVVAQDHPDRMNAVVMILNLDFKACKLPVRQSRNEMNQR
jgi:hypothetical protein